MTLAEPKTRVEPVSFIDLKAQQALIRERIERRLIAILDHGAYINGPEIAELEAELKARTGAAAVLGVSSGTDALVIALMAEGIGPGDAVFVPGFTYNATANSVLLCGAVPVFVDIDPATFNMCPADLARRVEGLARARPELTPRVVMPVDLFGLPADYEAIGAVAARHGMVLIADAAQSFGGAYRGRSVGTLALMSGTSFFPSKTLGGYGDGGAIFTTDAAKTEVLESIRWHGTDAARRESVRVGMNGRLDSFQAAVLLEKLTLFDAEHARRVAIAQRYDAALAGHVELPARPQDRVSAWALYTVSLDERDRVREALTAAGLPTAVYYLQTLPEMKAFAAYAPEGGLPNAERASGRVLTLPLHPYLSDAGVDRVCETLLGAL
ncbi:MAG: DegT/DnrJ/EryC1/StrS family aminotransferase [Alphaproteobacteria bacterium]|nr:DegT/DnrJ/EryC1/StrS family aminotransferase [Alphaproteobacteria bacterium]